MVSLWVIRIELGWSTINDVPERYRDAVKAELEIKKVELT